MAYIKHGTGPNDHKKGNRTRGENRKGNRTGSPNGKKNLDGLKAADAARTEFLEHYKAIAEERARRIKYNQEFAYTLMLRLSEYIKEQQTERRPLTIAGLIRAAEIGRDAYERLRSGDRDCLLYEYMDRNGIDYDMEGELVEDEAGEKVLLCRFSAIVKNAELAVQEQLEENCYTNKGNPAGSIFGLKAVYDWQDAPPDQRTTNNNTLVLNNVATLEEAREAMKRLNG